MEPRFKKLLIGVVALVFLSIVFAATNPFSWNDAGNRTVVERTDGTQIVQFQPGIFYAGMWAKEKEWPNQISVLYTGAEASDEVVDNSIEISQIDIRFNDATTAKVKGIVQYVLPSDDKEMILLHNTHRTPQSLVSKRLAPYTKECLQSSAQLMSAEKHYGGGRAQMSQDFLDQLRDGVFLLATRERVIYDSVERENKRIYETFVQTETAAKTPKRKISSLKEFGITVADGSITDVDYAEQVDRKLEKIIEATTKSAISKQDLMTAQQQSLTAEAEGKKKLVEIEYQQKQEQTKQVVAAQTRVEVAKQNKLEQQISYEKALIEVKERQAKADVTAYEKRTVIQADGALEQKLAAWRFSQEKQWEAFGKFQGNLVPQFQTGNTGTGTNALSFMEIMSMKAAKDLTLDLRIKD